MPAAIPVTSVADARALLGRELGPSPWLRLEQAAIDAFAEATRDHQWIHVDVERARAGPYAGTIAHGWLVLGLAPAMAREILDLGGLESSVNYGCDRVRFPSPAHAGCRLRLWLRIAAVDPVPGGCRVGLGYRMEREGSERPVCVAQAISQWRFREPAL